MTNFDAIRGRLAAALAEEGMTQTQFARRAGVSQSYVSQVLRGDSKPSIEVIVGAVEVLGRSATWLLVGVGPASVAGSKSAVCPRSHVLADLASARIGLNALEGMLEALAGAQSAGARSA